ncbi:MAG: hypothetical protein JNK54_09345 [Elusimicrobia bacterium]|nr:hypothetical protein [Elusimicrobiota bacterium]
MKKIIFYILIVTIVGVLGCRVLSPRQNFIEHIDSKIGRDISSIKDYEFGYRDDLIEERILPNGNLENKYLGSSHLGDCIYIFEIDPKTNKILSWRIEGDPNACIVNP